MNTEKSKYMKERCIIRGAAHSRETVISICVFFFFFFFWLFRATPAVYGTSQARGQIGASAASLYYSYSNAVSELCL